MFLTLYNNQKGEVFERPGLSMLGRSGSDWVEPAAGEMIPLPAGASLVSLPGYIPVGLDSRGDISCADFNPGQDGPKVSAVAALLPQGFTRTLLPAAVNTGKADMLSLMGYTAVGFKNNKIYVAAVQTDKHHNWHPRYYNTDGLPARIAGLLKKYPNNRIYRQLARCSLEYGCFTAQNIFYQRWEAGIPTTHTCNANCLGCISEDHLEVDSPQHRLNFTPEVREIAEVGIEHLKNARGAIISFGQGCEGEPALNSHDLAAAIRLMRQETNAGTINMNTNGGYLAGVKAICTAGLDAMRVTLFSCSPQNYRKYHRPLDYTLEEVKKSINYAGGRGVRVSLNLLVFPGFTDREDEIEHLLDFVSQNPVNMIQLRNLNIDPDYFFAQFPGGGRPLGIKELLKILRQEAPQIELGSYTHSVQNQEERTL